MDAAATATLADRWSSVPAELRARDQWVIWRRETRDGKSTKVPYQSRHPGVKAKSTEPATWGTFEDAVAATRYQGVGGIGFVLSPADPFCGLDFDDCIDRGEVTPWAAGLLRELGGYQEVSPSGRGVKVIVRASAPKGHKNHRVEVYSKARFFTITGELYNDPSPILDRQAVVDRIILTEFPAAKREKKKGPSPTIQLFADDVELLETARNAKNGAEFSALYDRGDTSAYHEDDSAADLALCSKLAFWCGPNPDRIDRLFRRSALMRPKWDEARGEFSYGEKTIDRAIDRDEFYEGPGPEPRIGNIAASAVSADGPQLEEIEWLPPRLDGPDPAPPFPLEVLPYPLRALATEGAASIQCPVDFLATQMVVLAGAAIGLSVNLRVKAHYNEAPNLYLALVGAPGDKKSPAIKLMARPLWRIDAELRARYDAEKRDYERRLDAWEASKRNPARGPRPDPPTHLQLTLDDATREAVAQIHSQNHRGLVVIKDELVAWVKALNAYKQGKGDDKQFWLSVNSGSLVKVSRKGSGEPLIVPQPCVAIVGGLTPDMLPDFRESRQDDGWLDRILFCYPDPPAADEWTDAEVSDEAVAEWEAAVRKLFARQMVPDLEQGRLRPFYTRMDDQAKQAWVDRVNAHRREKRDPEFPASLRGPWSKLEGFAARLVLILSQLEQACDPTDDAPPRDATALHVWGAWRLVDYFKAHLVRIKEAFNIRRTDDEDKGRAILRWLERSATQVADKSDFGRLLESRGYAWFARRDVSKNFSRWEDAQQDGALRWLVHRRCIRPRPATPRPGPGRPRSPEFEINPQLVAKFRSYGPPAETAETAIFRAAADWLRSRLAGGRVLIHELLIEAEARGLGMASIKPAAESGLCRIIQTDNGPAYELED